MEAPEAAEDSRAHRLTFCREDASYFFTCPHCDGGVFVQAAQLNCRIFRHAVLAATGEQVGPHAAEEECERLLAAGAVRGCCRPFRVVDAPTEDDLNALAAERCDYL